MRARSSDLRRQGGAGYTLRSTDDVRALEVARSQSAIDHALPAEHGLAFQAEESAVGELSLALGRAGIGILALAPELATLEDLFFRLTGETPQGAQSTTPSGRGGGPRGRRKAGVHAMSSVPASARRPRWAPV